MAALPHPLVPTGHGPRMPRTLIAHVEDRPGVLARVVSLFRRRGYNIASLTVARTHDPGVSRLTVVIDDVTTAPAVVHELALIKVGAEPRERIDVIELCKVFGARIVDVGSATLTVELTATRDAIDRLIGALEPHGIIDLVRTGAVAMHRGDAPPTPKNELSEEH